MVNPLFARIAHPTDLDPEGAVAFGHALRIAAAMRVPLDLIHVDREITHIEWGEHLDAERVLTRWGLDPATAFAGGASEGVTRFSSYGRTPIRPILDYLDESLADLMVLATHRRRGLDRWLHHEVAQKLARSRGVATLFVPIGDPGFVSLEDGSVHLERIVVPVDWLPSPQPAIDAATALGDACGAPELELTALHVGDSSDDIPAVSLPGRAGWRAARKTRAGDPVEVILCEARERKADLIVMVTQGHHGFLDALRGSTTERVLRSAPCPVLAVPAILD